MGWPLRSLQAPKQNRNPCAAQAQTTNRRTVPVVDRLQQSNATDRTQSASACLVDGYAHGYLYDASPIYDLHTQGKSFTCTTATAALAVAVVVICRFICCRNSERIIHGTAKPVPSIAWCRGTNNIPNELVNGAAAA